MSWDTENLFDKEVLHLKDEKGGKRVRVEEIFRFLATAPRPRLRTRGGVRKILRSPGGELPSSAKQGDALYSAWASCPRSKETLVGGFRGGERQRASEKERYAML